MGRREETREAIRKLLRQQTLGVLSTVGGDHSPYASLVAFAVSEDDSRLYFVTPTATRKYANITANPRVAFLVDNRAEHPDDFQAAAALTAVGSAHRLTSVEREVIRRQYVAKHPHLDEFSRAAGCELLAIRVDRYIVVEQLQKVTEYRIDPPPED